MRSRLVVAAALAALLSSSEAQADARGVGLGVAIGGSYSPTELKHGDVKRTVGGSFSWGFFVDIPLLETFYIAPSALLYELDLAGGKSPATDVDLNFKFVVPIRSLRLGAGVIAGLTNAEREYAGHWGALGFAGYKLLANFDAFAQVQYKKIMHGLGNVDDVHALAGGMFRF